MRSARARWRRRRARRARRCSRVCEHCVRPRGMHASTGCVRARARTPTTDAARLNADAKRPCLEKPAEASAAPETRPAPAALASAPPAVALDSARGRETAPATAPGPAPSSASPEVSRAISQLRRADSAEEVAACCGRLQEALEGDGPKAGVVERLEDVIVSCHPASLQFLPPVRMASAGWRHAASPRPHVLPMTTGTAWCCSLR